MKAFADFHCHTISSGHAYSTMEEMIKKAIDKGIKVLGIADHGPDMPGSCHLYHFYNLHAVPREIEGLILLKGVEANIIDYDGNIDLPEDALQKLDYAIASLHPPCIDAGTIEENTNAIIKAIENPYVKIIGHPDDSRYLLDYEAIVMAAKENNVALEVNNSSLKATSFREGAQENVRTYLKLCKAHGVEIIFGSDAHFSHSIADFSNCVKVIEELDFPVDLIINYDAAAINDLIGEEII